METSERELTTHADTSIVLPLIVVSEFAWAASMISMSLAGMSITGVSLVFIPFLLMCIAILLVL